MGESALGSKTGPHMQTAGKDGRKRQTTPGWCVAGNEPGNLHMRLVLGGHRVTCDAM